MRDVPVEHAHCQVAGWNQGHQRGDCKHQQTWLSAERENHGDSQDQGCQQGKGSEIRDGRVPLDCPSRAFAEAWAIRSFRFQPSHAIGDQKITNVRVGQVCAGGAGFFGHPQSGAGDFGLALFCSFANAFDDMPVAIARRKIHPRIHAGRILSQFRIDEADGFKKIFPIQGREQTHAGDDVADGNLSGGLALVLFLHDLFDRLAFLEEVFLQPFHDRHHRRILFAQTLRELDDERAAQRFAPGHARSKQWQ